MADQHLEARASVYFASARHQRAVLRRWSGFGKLAVAAIPVVIIVTVSVATVATSVGGYLASLGVGRPFVLWRPKAALTRAALCWLAQASQAFEEAKLRAVGLRLLQGPRSRQRPQHPSRPGGPVSCDQSRRASFVVGQVVRVSDITQANWFLLTTECCLIRGDCLCGQIDARGCGSMEVIARTRRCRVRANEFDPG